MPSIGSGLQPVPTPVRASLIKLLNSRWTFVGLQVLDLITTMIAFHLGAYEVNPLVAHLTGVFGRFRGVLLSKILSVIIAMGVRKLLWVVNLFYLTVILWNFLNLLVASPGLK